MKYNSVLFDLDGTLVDNREGIMNGFRHAMKALGREGEANNLPDSVIGPPLRSSFMSLYSMNAEQTEEAVRLYREYYRPIGLYESTLYPHVKEMLERLRAAGIGVYLATSKAQVFAEEILNHKGLMPYFDGVVGCGLDGRLDSKTDIIRHLLDNVIKPNHLPAVMVGDRSHDAIGAANCGMDAAAALWGFGTKEEFLSYANVKALCENAEELCNWLLEE